METLQYGEYTITGVLTNDGKNVYYEGTQNLVYAPNYRAYLVALNKVIEAMNECICGEPVIDYRKEQIWVSYRWQHADGNLLLSK